jgi:hypothetical protein
MVVLDDCPSSISVRREILELFFSLPLLAQPPMILQI